MSKLRSVVDSVVGDIEQTGSERHFITVACFIISLFLMVLCFIHLIMNLKVAPVYFAGSSSIVILGLYFLVRFGKCLYVPKLALTVLGLVMLDLTWYSKFLSSGPVLFFLLILGALILWVWEGKSLVVLLIIYFLNIVLLFIIDYTAPDYLFRYPDLRIRSIDIFLSFLLYSSIMIFLLSVIKKDFIRQKERAIRSDKLKSAFLSNMSHEIRTPMNAIVGFSELLENENDYVKRHQYINIIKNSGNNLLKLINDIIDLSKIEAGDLQLNLTNFSIRELFTEITEIYTLELLRREKSDIKLNCYLPDGDYIIYSDLIRLKQVLFNLLNNSVKFTAHGSISFSCEKKRGELLFSVSDTGTGIPEADQKRIFDRFSKFNYEGMNNEGSGIGLSIVEKVIGMLNGIIWLNSVEGTGTTFYFSIPLMTGTRI
jgi:signal transduction histidine kinase